jgi:hypothetical protein
MRKENKEELERIKKDAITVGAIVITCIVVGALFLILC